MDLIKRAKEDCNGAQRFNRTALVLLDQQSAQTKGISTLESQVETLVDVIGRLQQQLNQSAEALELQRSQALSEQQVALAGARPRCQLTSPLRHSPASVGIAVSGLRARSVGIHYLVKSSHQKARTKARALTAIPEG